MMPALSRLTVLSLLILYKYLIVRLQHLAGQFLKSLAKYPPRQTLGSFNLEKIQKQVEAGKTSSGSIFTSTKITAAIKNRTPTNTRVDSIP